jgi:hypothetical protein
MPTLSAVALAKEEAWRDFMASLTFFACPLKILPQLGPFGLALCLGFTD